MGRADRYRRYKRKMDVKTRREERARERGTQVPLHVLAQMTPEQARAYVLRHKGDQP